jgi:hypothetical protein
MIAQAGQSGVEALLHMHITNIAQSAYEYTTILPDCSDHRTTITNSLGSTRAQIHHYSQVRIKKHATGASRQ